MADTDNLNPETPMEDFSDEIPSHSRFNKKLIIRIIGIIVTIIVFIAFVFYIISLFTRASSHPLTTSNSSPTPESSTAGFDKALYGIDSDGDKIPNFLESKLGLDSQKNEVQNCFVDECAKPTYQQAYVKKHNVLIMLDSSGSMNLKSGQSTKMDAAKQAIVSIVNSVKDEAQVGLMIYGHLGSNSTKDKSTSCASADTLAPIGNLTAANVNDVLSPIKPVGWTPIGLALQKSKDLFVGKERDDNEVFIVTDGEETCDTDPVTAARTLAESSSHVKVNVIGFAVTDLEQTSLRAINAAGKGTYDNAKNSADITDIFQRHRQNWTTLVTANDCLETELSQMTACTVDLHTKIDNFRNGYAKNSAYTISQDEWNANEKVYYSYIMYLQDFVSQKTNEINQKRGNLGKDIE